MMLFDVIENWERVTLVSKLWFMCLRGYDEESKKELMIMTEKTMEVSIKCVELDAKQIWIGTVHSDIDSPGIRVKHFVLMMVKI